MRAGQFSPDLIRRHNVPGPRYTSYPTADRFRESDWTDAYSASLADSCWRALSLYLHVPFCSTICFYCGCNKINTANLRHAGTYVQRLKKELELHSRLIAGRHRVEQLHFGGGTPTFLSDDEFEEIFDAISSYYCLSEDDTRDFSIEIDPRQIPAERIRNLARLGINRVNVGVQDFDIDVQRAVNRVQSVEETRAVIDAARENGINSINIDLINGLPLQSVDGFRRTLEQVILLSPDRLSLYSYAHLPHRFKTQRQIRTEDLPDPATKLGVLELSVNMLMDAGYEFIGMDHFAKPTDSLVKAMHDGTLHRNFQGYTTHGHCELIAAGVSAIGKVGNIYVQNVKVLRDYYQAIDADRLPIERGLEVSEEDRLTAAVIQDLMCRFEANFADFEARAGVAFESYYAERWSRLEGIASEGLIELHSDRLEVTPRGRFLLRNICMIFDDYLNSAATKYSRAI